MNRRKINCELNCELICELNCEECRSSQFSSQFYSRFLPFFAVLFAVLYSQFYSQFFRRFKNEGKWEHWHFVKKNTKNSFWKSKILKIFEKNNFFLVKNRKIIAFNAPDQWIGSTEYCSKAISLAFILYPDYFLYPRFFSIHFLPFGKSFTLR